MSSSWDYYWNLGTERLSKVYIGTELIWSNDPEWGGWSDWQDTPVTATENREVETKQQHRYQDYKDYEQEMFKVFKDCWSRATASPNCATCTSRPSGGYGFWRGTWINNRGNYHCHGAYTGIDKGWGYGTTLNAKSGWVDGYGTETDIKRITDRRTRYRYRINLNA
jgi:hypothetical protein